MLITVLIPSGRQNPTKEIQIKDGGLVVNNYPPVKNWNHRTIEFDDIRHFAQELSSTLASSRVIMILGTPVDGLPTVRVRRNSQNFSDQGTDLISIDIDGIPVPSSMNPYGSAAIRWFIKKQLPPCFHDVTCAIQLSASAGIVDPATGLPIKPGLNAHIYFQSDRPIPIWLIKELLRNSLVDSSLYTPVQPHYIADPIIGEGVECKIPRNRRHFLIEGNNDVVTLPEIGWVPQGKSVYKTESEWVDPVGGLPEQRHIMACEFMRWFVTEPPKEHAVRYPLARAFATNAYRTAGDSESFTAEGLDANHPDDYLHRDKIISTLPGSRPLSCRQIVSDGFDCPHFKKHGGDCKLMYGTYSPFALALRIKRKG